MAVDLFSQEYLRNPAAKLEELRSQGSVVRVRFPVIGKVWATTTQQLADRVLKDNATFTQCSRTRNTARFVQILPIMTRMRSRFRYMGTPSKRWSRSLVGLV